MLSFPCLYFLYSSLTCCLTHSLTHSSIHSLSHTHTLLLHTDKTFSWSVNVARRKMTLGNHSEALPVITLRCHSEMRRGCESHKSMTACSWQILDWFASSSHLVSFFSSALRVMVNESALVFFSLHPIRWTAEWIHYISKLTLNEMNIASPTEVMQQLQIKPGK